MIPFSNIFLAAFIVTYGLKLWLTLRQMRHVWQHRDTPPAAFASVVSLEDHRKAADYTLAKSRLALTQTAVEGGLLAWFTLGGGLEWLRNALATWVSGNLWQGALLLLGMMMISALVEIPLSMYRQFRVEARFGFNRQTLPGFFADLAKEAALGLALGLPLIMLTLWLMAGMGDAWWLWVWLAWMAFNLLVLAVYPTFIAPLFNSFKPLEDIALKARIEDLLQRTGFRSQGVFVMDGSKRSAHGNAYFTGLGKAKRIVFFDTLLEHLSPEQTEAVLAHELGHYKRRHIAKRIVLMFGLSLAMLYLLAWIKGMPWFYSGLGVSSNDDATALALFFLVLPVFTFPLTPLMSLYSRKHEFEADAYAAAQAHPAHLIAALVKLYRDNASTLTPDPVYSLFYDSHPKASERIGRLEADANTRAQPMRA
jgi:STE24 endopeptidase